MESDSSVGNGAFPVAIIGAACRFPGASNLEEYWSLLKSGADAIGTIPPDRWDVDFYYNPDQGRAARMYTKAGGFLDRPYRFDAEFFGISPREAAQIDPQQRLVLELVWEALESAGIVPASIAGGEACVVMGVSNTDYSGLQREHSESNDPYVMSGSAGALVSNRVSYILDLHGPSYSLDTACSSALVAVHQACEALRRDEAPLAIAGGVNFLLSPFATMGFSRARMLSPTGHCHSFDAAADGYVRSEGGGVVILKPLAAALADGDPIHGVIVGSGINSDGKTNGISMPNTVAQEALLRRVYARAGIDPFEVDYVEAHGTGTGVGDPVECSAIGAVIGAGRTDGKKCLIGSGKTNIGHLESAAGIAGLIKVLLALKHREIPATINVETLNPKIKFDELNLSVVTERTPLAAEARSLIMGVNSFGFGGANAHIIVREHRADTPPESPLAADSALLAVSARSAAALKELAARYERMLRQNGADVIALRRAAARTRSHLPHRLAVSGNTAAELAEGLAAFVADNSARNVGAGEVVGSPARLAFVFSGNGSQWLGMGRELIAREPLIARWIDKVDAVLRPLVGWSLLDYLAREGVPENAYDKTEIAQPTMFALQVAMVEWLRAQGVDAEACVGHSVGEVAAAYAAGALTLEQACRVIAHRSAVQGKTAGMGKMMAVGLSAAKTSELIAPYRAGVTLAAFNSQNSVTLAGDEEVLSLIGAQLERDGAFHRLLPLDYAFHSRVMDGVKGELLERLSGLSPSDGTGRFVSTVTGGALAGRELGAQYWWENIREPVRFGDAIDGLIKDGVHAFLEIGPHAVLTFYIRDCLRDAGVSGAALATLRRQEPEVEALRMAVAQCYTAGVAIDFATMYPGKGPWAALPTYPWQGEDHVFPKRARQWSPVVGTWQHPLLGYRLTTAAPTWEQVVETWRLAYLRDHVVQGSMVFPAAGYVEMALAAGALRHGNDAVIVEGLAIEKPIVIAEADPPRLEFALYGDDNSFRVSAGVFNDLKPASVATGRVVPIMAKPVLSGTGAVEELRARLTRHLSGDEHYRLCAEHGLAYGPAFRGVADVWFTDDEALGRIVAPSAVAPEASDYALHPAVLDACIQTVFATFAWASAGARNAAFVPVAIERLRLYRPHALITWCHARLTERRPRAAAADFQLYDEKGLVAEIEGLRLRRIDAATVPAVPTYHWQYQLGGRTAHRATPVPLLAVAKTVRDMIAAIHNDSLTPMLERIAAAYAARAVESIGGGAANVSLDDLIAQGKVGRRNLLYLRNLMTMLEERGVLTHAGQGWRRVAASEAPDTLWRDTLAAHPDRVASLELIARAGDRIEAFLAGSGEDDAHSPLIRDADLVEQLTESDPLFARRNHAIAGIVSRLLRAFPPAEPFRVLEIGGGPDGLAATVLPLLPSDRASYDYAAQDEEGVARASANFADQPMFRARVLELDRALDAADREAFDLVLIGNGMFGAPELKSGLTAVSRLTRPGGFVAIASAGSGQLMTFLFGMASRWWNVTDIDLRAEGPLVSADTWTGLLRDAGFADVESLGDGIQLAQKRPAPRFTEVNEGEPGEWLIAAPAGNETVSALGDRLDLQGHRVTNLEKIDRQNSSAALRDMVGEAGNGRLNAVYVAGGETSPQAGLDGAFDAVALLQAAEELGVLSRLNLWVVTTGAMPAPGRTTPVDPTQAMLWGIGRTMMTERPDLTCRLIDLDPGYDAETAAACLIDELARLATDAEDEVILAGGARYVDRVRRGSPPVVTYPAQGYGLVNVRRDGRDEMILRALPPRELTAGQVQVRVRASGLNFRDVLQRGGILPDEAFEGGFAGATLGMEFAGEIVAIGASVSRFKTGDAVFGFAPSALGSLVVADERALFARPALWSDAEAATVPVAMITALFSLEHLARLKKGERVLIHGAGGGVGLAAIQIAQAIGAEIYATAGTAEKRAFLGRLGVRHVFDSRTLEFDHEIRRETQGEGIDVVLNSIAGEAIAKGMSLLRPYGRFVELGKRDFFANSKLGLEPFRHNIQFFGVDINTLIAERPELMADMVKRLMALIADGTLKPLAHRAFPASRAAEAFRYMHQSRQIGKVVITFPDDAPPVEPLTHAKLALRGDATYLVTGGRSGFGLGTAEWLTTRGARHLALLGRRAQTEPAAAAVLGRLRAQGVTILEATGDVTDAGALDRVLAEIDRNMPPLKGVFHAAGVIEDALLAKLTRERFDAVVRPKVLGAFNLHEATCERVLDWFVLYSSATTVIGNPGQASYVAANLYLEGLARYRRARGLPALAMLWGAIGKVGHLAKNPDLAKTMEERLGVMPIDPARAFDGLEQAMLSGVGEVAVAELNWTKLSRLPRIADAPKYAGFGTRRDGVDASVSLDELKGRIALVSIDEAAAMLVPIVGKQISEVMRIPAAKLDTEASLLDVGMDSMMMVELQMMMERTFGLRLPVLDLMDRATISGISRRLAEEFQREPQTDGAADRDNFDIDIDAVPEEKLDEVLGKLLKEELDIGP
ncbi:MAG TPA: SDR family NAD(P)-dependent oxidoreductase [Stellaceae bacterium]